MKCSYCGACNHEDDHRCAKCGKRLRERPAVELVNRAATAPAVAQETAPPTQAPPVDPPPSRPRLVYQAPLFGPQVIPTAGPHERPRPPRNQRALRQAADPDLQQNLFVVHSPAPRTLKTSVEASIYCEAPVAGLLQRFFAAALDVALIVIGSSLALAVFLAWGGEIVLNRQTGLCFAVIPAGAALFYRTLWCAANGDSPGLRWMGLRLLNFDGRSPGRRERFVRLASGCLSFCAAGLGLFWALTDEEKLTWHDHISKTFPTPVQTRGARF